ncbi:TlpA disulfide reductase family protein [candidate division KSB1 bacterium]
MTIDKQFDFTGTDINGSEIRKFSLKDKTYLIFFFSSWCPVCMRAFPALNRISGEMKNKDLRIIGIPLYSGDFNDINGQNEIKTADFEIIIPDEGCIKQYGVIGFPTYFLLKPDGALYKKYVGEAEDLHDRIASDILKISG